VKEQPHLRLAGVTRLALDGRGPASAFVFDPHRLALPCWALALEEANRAPAFLLTLDRHFDLAVPTQPQRVPDRRAGFLALDAHARLELDTRNIDHVVAAMEAGIVGDVLALARSSPEGATPLEIYRDRKGVDHRILRAPSLEQWLDGGGRLPPGDDPVLLDVDLDCFTSPSDVDPRVVLPWTQSIVRDHLLPEGSSAFWDALLPRTVALTLAREPYHCGGLLGAGRLLAQVAPVLFGELLGSSFA
jgi:hypothetical protein